MPPPCHDVTVFTFGGKRSRAFSSEFLGKLKDQQFGIGTGPSSEECLIHTGHTGVQLSGSVKVFGFHPNPGSSPVCNVLD